MTTPLPDMPEPVFFLDHDNDTFIVPREERWTGAGLALRSNAYTEDQTLAYGLACYRAGMEAAAKKVERMVVSAYTAKGIATAIREAKP